MSSARKGLTRPIPDNIELCGDYDVVAGQTALHIHQDSCSGSPTFSLPLCMKSPSPFFQPLKSAARRGLSGLERSLLILRATLLNRRDGIEGISRLLLGTRPEFIPYLLQRYGAVVGERTSFCGALSLQNARADGLDNLVIGRHVYVGKHVLLDLVDSIELGDEVVLSANVSIFTHADPGDRPLREFFPRRTGPVVIGAGSWLGAGSIILHGVAVGPRCVIGAGSVVTTEIPPYSVAVGVPAKVIRTLRREPNGS
jgi:acetyltransferase-like isoleucine patch superfamily enzyme